MGAVSFDLDGVLIQNPFARGVGPRMREHIRANPSLAGLAREAADRRIDEAVRRRWSERMAAGDFVAAYDWDGIYTEVSREFGGGTAPDVATLVAGFCEDPEMIHLLPGALECLEALAAEGYRLYAATNGYHAYQWPVLEALGIARFFAGLLSPDRLGVAKPDRRFFEVPGLEVHVGDTLQHDVLGANLAGVQAVWVAPELPEGLRALHPGERPRHPSFRPFLEASLDASPYQRFHPEADLVLCTPAAVVRDVGELPAWLASIRASPT